MSAFFKDVSPSDIHIVLKLKKNTRTCTCNYLINRPGVAGAVLQTP